MPGQRVVQAVDRVAAERGLPRELVLDNGPEFTGRALEQWAHDRGVVLRFIEPVGPSRTPSSRSSSVACAGRVPQRALVHEPRRRSPHRRSVATRLRSPSALQRARLPGPGGVQTRARTASQRADGPGQTFTMSGPTIGGRLKETSGTPTGWCRTRDSSPRPSAPQPCLTPLWSVHLVLLDLDADPRAAGAV